ncbi:hypothetical protein LCGC14_0389150 [marine sediment metagenome]|uniref:PABS domain-containing protein n=1 Tax=marine sediment metagenome TaxID=412755 RepID=A0A0F9T5U3_9ZZZZ|nr:hypothetical protein [Phycisphaerae bacterium]HDZ43900.1 hypothetical protein [Phycisphaerae bacterium]
MKPLLVVLFFFSGVAALVYQVVWHRMLVHVFGATSLAVTTVLSAFMAGLALGSYVGGRWVDRHERPLRLFALLQFGIAVFALAFPFLLVALTKAYVLIDRALFIHGSTSASWYTFSVLRFVLAFAVLLIPTTLMGATLPVIAKVFVRRADRLGTDMSSLYSANNFGAMLGALAAGFVLMEALGVRESGFAAAGVSLAIGVVALLLQRKSGAAEATTAATDACPTASVGASGSPQYPRYVYTIVLWVFAIEGFTTLGYEVVWTRMLAAIEVVHNIYAYSLVIATVIAGLALGSYLIRFVVDRRRDLLSWVAAVEILIALSVLTLLPLFKASADWLITIERSFPDWRAHMAVSAAWMALLMLIPATLMGATFPLVSRIYTRDLQHMGRRIGLMGCLDTVGSIAGAAAAGFLLIPLLGMQHSVLVLAAVNLLLGLAVVVTHPRMRPARRGLVATAAAVVVVVLLVRGAPNVTFVPSSLSAERGVKMLYYEEGPDTTVFVGQYADGRRFIATNGVDVAGTSRMLKTTQITQAHLPALLFEALNGRPARNVLTIGMGSGQTSHSLSLHGFEDIHCCELVEGVQRAARAHFADLSRGVFDDPRYRVFIQDARTYIQATDVTYDLILDDSVHPGYAGNASLYSRDFFADCRARLSPDGVMSVWTPLFALDHDMMRMIVASFLDVFPYATMWFGTNCMNKHVVLIGTQRPLELDLATFRNRLADPGIRDDLAQVDLEEPAVLLNCLLMDETSLAAYAAGGEIHSDNRPRLEFASAKVPQTGPRPLWFKNLIEMTEIADRHGSDVLNHLGEVSPADRQRLRRERRVAELLKRGYAGSLEAGRLLEQLERLTVRPPNQRDAAWRQEMTRVVEGMIGSYRKVAIQADEAMAINVASRSARLLACEALTQGAMAHQLRASLLGANGADDFEQARKLAAYAVELDAQYGPAYLALAHVHAARGEIDLAIQLAEKGAALLPENKIARQTVSTLRHRRYQSRMRP